MISAARPNPPTTSGSTYLFLHLKNTQAVIKSRYGILTRMTRPRGLALQPEFKSALFILRPRSDREPGGSDISWEELDRRSLTSFHNLRSTPITSPDYLLSSPQHYPYPSSTTQSKLKLNTL
ncbi:hypothetical protein QCA50_019340 [Cerrena zonata]|uniref:Uncharacterized protein n=1 Tax=Cerrena zonata TaxID=2478898 RepID=A0AAW0FHN8_9APHY